MVRVRDIKPGDCCIVWLECASSLAIELVLAKVPDTYDCFTVWWMRSDDLKVRHSLFEADEPWTRVDDPDTHFVAM